MDAVNGLFASWCVLPMSLFRAILALLCSIAVAASPAAAAWMPCCCIGKAVHQPSCHLQSSHSAKSVARACCAKKQSVKVKLVNPCSCCSKQTQPLESRSPTINPIPSVDLCSWVSPQVTRTISVSRWDVAELGADPLFGPQLLALLCRWLN